MDLMELLPGFYAASPEVVGIQRAFGRPVEDLWQAYDQLMAQLDVATSTWGLRFWEEQYGLATDVSKPLEERRARVLSKMRGLGVTTASMLAAVAQSFVHGAVDIREHPASYWFELLVREAGEQQSDLRGLTQAIGELRPAHLDFLVRDLPPIIPLSEAMAFRFQQLGVHIPISNIRQAVVLLDGKGRLGGDWLLNQALQGIAFPVFQVAGLSWQTTPTWQMGRMDMSLLVSNNTGLGPMQWMAVIPLQETEQLTCPSFWATLIVRTKQTIHPHLALTTGWTTQEQLGLGIKAACAMPVKISTNLDTMAVFGIKTAWVQQLTAHLTMDSLYHLDSEIPLDGRRKLNASIREEQL